MICGVPCNALYLLQDSRIQMQFASVWKEKPEYVMGKSCRKLTIVVTESYWVLIHFGYHTFGGTDINYV